MLLFKVILAILLPPVAAYLEVGATKLFWISLVLSLFFFVPGQIFTLWVVLSKQGEATAPAA